MGMPIPNISQLLLKTEYKRTSPSILIVNRLTMMKDPTLSQQQRRELCDDITNQDVWSGLQAMEDDKALGIDGCNSHFFKHDWPILKDEVTVAVTILYIGKIFKAINCTTITLVPKNPSPMTIKEYRPIACCIIL
ncbi:uncharacterized protein LOC142181774 [Nicotiana tabacum]|uniref:Uncharacterized protein LOC142181774 n=1 Tax=Nicotiana tabacum TaxID=4097 RepID=A0AC58UPH5_TOBAC